MKLKNKSMLLAFLLVIVFALSSCTPAVQTSADKAKQNNILRILEEAQGDMESVRTILNDADLNMAGEQKDEEDTTNITPEAQLQEFDTLLVKIQGYEADLDKRVSAIGVRDAGGDPVLQSFNKSELHCIQLLNEVLFEYEGIINYVKVLYNVGTSIGALGTMDPNNPDPWYNSFSEAIKTTLDMLNTTTPPSFLQSFHADLIKGIEEAKSSVEYIISASLIPDPLMIDAGMYRIGLFTRDFNTALTKIQSDIDRREAKIKEDALNIKRQNDGLSAWIEKNMARLDNEEGSATK